MSIAQNFPNIKPSLMLSFADTKQLDNRVTFTRSTPAVYYDGKTTAMAEQNLLLYSQDFSNFWGLTGNTITPDNTTAPDGTTTADKTERTTTGLNAIVVSSGLPSSLGVPKTVSIYAKAGTKSVIQWDANTANWNNDFYVNFDLSAGTISANSAGVPASITSVGNGWYRCSITSSGVGTQVIWVVCDSPTSLRESTSTAGYLYIWGAQYEQRASATAYTPTTTQPITNYIPVLLTAGGNQPRFDCNPTTGESLGLLIEEQRTNIALYSEQFDNGVWARSITGLTPNTVISPDGTLDGDKLFESTSSGYQNIFQNVSQAATTYTYSLYVKKGENNRFVMFAGSPQALLWIDMTTWTVFNSSNVVSSSITSVGNGWYRCAMTYTNTSASTFQTGLNLVQVGTTNTVSYAGNGFNGIYVWGAQLEAGAFATSYIATTSASATRTADAASMTGANFSSWFNNAEGTVFLTYRKNVGTSGRLAVFESNSLTVSTNGINIDLTSATNARTEGFANGANYWYLNQTVAQQSVQNLVLGYKTNDIGFSANAATPTTDTTAVMASTGITAFAIGSRIDGSASLNGYLNKIAYYPLRVTNAQLQALTS